MPTINMIRPTTGGAIEREVRASAIADVVTTFPQTQDVDIPVTTQDTAGTLETFRDVQITSGEKVLLIEAKSYNAPNPIMKQVWNLLAQLDSAEQRQVMGEFFKLVGAAFTKKEIERQGIHGGNLGKGQVQKTEMRPAVRPEVEAAIERAMLKYAPDLEYLKDK